MTNERSATSTKCREMHQWQKHFGLWQELNEWKYVYCMYCQTFSVMSGWKIILFIFRSLASKIPFALAATFWSYQGGAENSWSCHLWEAGAGAIWFESPCCHQPGDRRRNIVPISETGQKYSISFETMFRFWAWAAFWEKRMSVKLNLKVLNNHQNFTT